MNEIDLASICYKVDGNATNDISWIPIGTSTHQFKGTFDGKGNTIKKIYINKANDNQALFAYNNGTIQNVNLGKETVIGGNCTAGLVSRNSGKVIRCTNLLTNVTANNAVIVGGLVAINNNLVNECCNKAYVTVNGASGEMQVGGIVGQNNKNVYSSYNIGEITATMTENNHINVGGVIGYDWNIAEGLYNRGKIAVKKTTDEYHF